MPKHRFILALLGLLLVLASVSTTSAPTAFGATTFTDELITPISAPTSLTFTADGRMLITTQAGQLRVFQNNALLATPAIDLAARGVICSNFERGLLGVAADPNFATNHYIYLYYTYNLHNVNPCPQNSPSDPNNPVNRVSRFVLPATNQIDPATELVLIDNIPSPNGNHNAGDLHFGKDGYLYITIGDGGADYALDSGGGGSNDAARDQFVLLGKVLRITRDGGIPTDNPYAATGARCNVDGRNNANKPCQETFASGLRNPFRLAFDPNSTATRFYINDVGQNAWEEIDEGQKGADYGWNCREGKHSNSTSGKCNPTPAGLVEPLYDYAHANGCNSITGGAFVPNGVWDGFDGAYLFSDYGCGRIFRLNAPTSQGGSYTASELINGLGGPVSLLFNPFDPSAGLYYTTYSGGGQVRRLQPDVLTARVSAAPQSGSPPLTVAFDGSASSSPTGGAAITAYLWDFGDGSATVETTTPTTSHVYTTIATRTASLRVRDTGGQVSAPAFTTITVGIPPTAVIDQPAPNKTFAVGETITLQGHATDHQGNPISGDKLEWRVLLHHSNHTHPFLGPVAGATTSLTGPAPEDLLAATNSYLELQLTATDSNGLTSTITQTLQPEKVALTFATDPAGLTVQVSDQTLIGPTTITSWNGYQIPISAPVQPTVQGWLRFDHWSQGGTSAQTITTPATATTYTATFVAGEIIGLPLIAVGAPSK